MYLPPRQTAALLICALLTTTLFACSDRGDEPQPQATTQIEEDVGTDTDEAPLKAAPNFEEASPGTPTRTIVSAANHRGIIADNPPLAAQNFLSPQDIEPLLGDAELESSQIAGQPPSATYNSIRYAPTESPDQFGLGLQIWRLEKGSLTERLTELRGQFLNVQKADHKDAPSTSFISERAQIRTFVFPSKDELHLFALSCDLKSCPDWAPLYELGTKLANSH